MRLTLKDEGFPYKKIYNGRRWIGRVSKCADGRYLGIIGETKVYAETEQDAFRDAGARHMGFSSVGELQRHNTIARHRQKVERAEVAAELDKLLKPFFDGRK